MESVRVVILGDIGASEENADRFAKGDRSLLIDTRIASILDQADIRIANLEKPLTDLETPLGYCAPDYRAPVASVNFLSAINLTAVSLANNHIMDQRDQGLYSTISALRQKGIIPVGAGENLSQARKAVVMEKNGVRIGVYACVEHEFSIATSDSPGANPFDPLESLDHIVELRESCDLVIVLYHGGTEGYPYPTPWLQRVCRRMCDKGADLVVCQHSHCIGCEEQYENSRIVYGQGNFLLDNIPIPCWKTSLLIEVEATKNGLKEIRYFPLRRSPYGTGIAEDENDLLECFRKRSEEIRDPIFLESQYIQFCKTKEGHYFANLMGMSRFMQRVLRRLGLLNLASMKYGKKRRNVLYDYIMCDAHREAITRLCMTIDN